MNTPFKPLRINGSLGNYNSASRLKKKPRLESKDLKNDIINVNVKDENDQQKKCDKSTEHVGYSVLIRKISLKKNKVWENDGNLLVEVLNGNAILRVDNDILTRGKVDIQLVKPNQLITLGSYELEIGEELNTTSLSLPHSQKNSKSNNLQNSLYKSPLFPTKSLSPTKKKNLNNLHNDITIQNPIIMRKLPFHICAEKDQVDVKIDPLIAKKLRPHQIEGIKFMYECVMKIRTFKGQGALLADEMGLGKTLMVIGLLWTLLKQSPLVKTKCTIRRALIVCPVTLIDNWKNEFIKWIGRDRIGIFIANSRHNISEFIASRVYQVMIIGYERVLSLKDSLNDAGIDIIVCDEGHRLKNSNSKVFQFLAALECQKRLILTGTPIQNDLSEFYAMIDFINPGVLGTYSEFKKYYEIPIMKSRQPHARTVDKEQGKDKTEKLSSLTKNFILRRTSEMIKKFLPPKNEYIIFCQPTSQQIAFFKAILSFKDVDEILDNYSPQECLKLITLLKKVSNNPSLLKRENQEFALRSIPADLLNTYCSSSGKVIFLTFFLKQLLNNTDEKVVIVSGSTKTLDMLQGVLSKVNGSFMRLDGSTPTKERQKIINAFNNGDQKSSFAFLLSAKSGGAGINLIGASRLFLFDTDWNPSVDLQAMARIHRDGQNKPVFIYRLLTTGTIDEKIFQRQLTKQGLADNFIDAKENFSNSFSPDDLKDLFTFHEDTSCQTHQILGCNCKSIGAYFDETEIKKEEDENKNEFDDDFESQGFISAKQVIENGDEVPELKSINLDTLKKFSHTDPSKCTSLCHINDVILEDTIISTKTRVSYVFAKTSI